MQIEFAMAAYLATIDDLTDIVGTKIFADKAPQKKSPPLLPEPPFITYETDGGEKYYHMRGASGLANGLIQLMCHHRTYALACDLYEVLRDKLDGFSGTWSGVVVRSAFLTEPVNASQIDIHRANDIGHPAVVGSLNVHYFRTVPALDG